MHGRAQVKQFGSIKRSLSACCSVRIFFSPSYNIVYTQTTFFFSIHTRRRSHFRSSPRPVRKQNTTKKKKIVKNRRAADAPRLYLQVSWIIYVLYGTWCIRTEDRLGTHYNVPTTYILYLSACTYTWNAFGRARPRVDGWGWRRQWQTFV